MKQASVSDTKPKRPSKSGSKTRSARGRSAPSKSAGRRRRRSAGNGNGIANSLMARGRSAFDGATNWAGEVPSAMRNMHLPDRRTLQSMADERPLLLGAVGLGIGVLIGALLPSMHGASHKQRRSANR